MVKKIEKSSTGKKSSKKSSLKDNDDITDKFQ